MSAAVAMVAPRENAAVYLRPRHPSIARNTAVTQSDRVICLLAAWLA